jgi:succinate dehydrogenase / fumarate reductase cytochrome b subunit
MLWGLHFSLTDIGFDTLQDWFTSFPVHLLIWLLLAPLCYHLVAGIRHLLADVHMGDTLKAGRIGSVLTFVIFIILMVLAGIWLW